MSDEKCNLGGCPNQMRNQRTSRRRGSIYVVVLGVSMTVAVIGLAALLALRIEHRTVETGGDFAQTRLYAQSAIEMGFFWIADDPEWRNNRPTTGVWVVDLPIGNGTFTLEAYDPEDDNLQAEPNNSFVLIGTGMQGEARYKLQVTVIPEKGGYEIAPGSWRQVVD